MYIRRDRSNLHFGRRNRRPWRSWLFTFVVMAALSGFIVWQFDQIEAEVQTILGEPPTPTPSAPTTAREGFTAFVNGDLEDAEISFAESVRMVPDNLDYLFEYGHILLLQNKSEEGLAIAEQIGEIDNLDPRGHALKVLALYQLDRVDEAISAGLSSLELNKTFAPTYSYMAWAYADIGRWTQAVQMAERAVELAPEDFESYRAYAYALTWVGAREQSAQALEKAIELHPTLDFLYFEVAEKYRALENVPAAIAAYERVLAIAPSNARALLRLCETYFWLREDSRAQEYCEQALDVDPLYTPAWRQVGQVYYLQSKYQQAIDALDNCVEQGSDDIRCYYVRGLAYYYLDRCDLAVPILQESLERTQSDRILGFIRQGLRLCEQPVPDEFEVTPTPDGETAAGS